MRILDIFKPTPATIEFGQRVFNLVYRVVFTTTAIVALGALAIGIGYAVGYAANLGAQAGGANDTIKQFVKNGSTVLYVVTVIVSWLFAATDPVRLALLTFSNRRSDDDNPDHET